jgi:hypothetical protein
MNNKELLDYMKALLGLSRIVEVEDLGSNKYSIALPKMTYNIDEVVDTLDEDGFEPKITFEGDKLTEVEITLKGKTAEVDPRFMKDINGITREMNGLVNKLFKLSADADYFKNYLDYVFHIENAIKSLVEYIRRGDD